jgi:hypothetical protein
MIDHSGLLIPYQQARAATRRLNDSLVKSIPTNTLRECGRILGMFHDGTFVFNTDDESSVLMDYSLYYPEADGRHAVAKLLENSPPPAGSNELIALQSMSRAYYSMFQVIDVEPGVGVMVEDLFRDETSFIVDIGFGNSASRQMILASRIIPMDGFLMSTGAALPVDDPTARRIFQEVTRSGYTPEKLDFKQIITRQEAEFAAILIRECLSAGMTSQVAYEVPTGSPGLPPGGTKGRKIGRNERCPCGSGKKFKVCCGGHL